MQHLVRTLEALRLSPQASAYPEFQRQNDRFQGSATSMINLANQFTLAYCVLDHAQGQPICICIFDNAGAVSVPAGRSDRWNTLGMD